MDLFYMKAVRILLNTLGQWPNMAFGSRSRRSKMLRAYNIFIIVLWCILHINVMTYLKLNIADMPFIDAGQVYTNAILNCLFIQRSCLPLQKKYQNVVKKFVTEFHMVHHEHMSEYAKKETTFINKVCRIGTIIILLQLFFGILSYNSFTLLINISAGMFSEDRPENKTFVMSVDYLVPFDYKTNTKYYWLIFNFNWYPCYNVPTSMCIYDLLMFVILFHIFGHISILSHSLKSFPRPSGGNEESLQEYNEQVFGLLKDVIRHYQIIKEFMFEISDAFDLTLCSYLAFHQVMCCLVLLEVSTMERDALGRYGILTLVIFQQLIQMSLIFEIIHTKCPPQTIEPLCQKELSALLGTELQVKVPPDRRQITDWLCRGLDVFRTDVLGDQVYGLPWEDMNVSNRKIVLFFLRNVQTPLCMKAGGMVPVGVLTMSTIIRTSFSYFLLLKTLA